MFTSQTPTHFSHQAHSVGGKLTLRLVDHLRRLGRIAVPGMLMLLAAGCGKGPAKTAATEPPKIDVATPIVQSVSDYEEFVGRTSAIKHVDIKSQVSGKLVITCVGEDANSVRFYKITDTGLSALRSAQTAVPEPTLAKLKPLKNKEFTTRIIFADQLAKLLDADEFQRYQRTIARQAADLLPGMKLIDEGDDVKAGDILFVIEQPPFKDAVDVAQRNVDNLKEQQEYNQRYYDRNKNAGIGVTKDDLEKAYYAARSLDAQVKQGEAQLRQAQQSLDWSTIRAPFDGRISKRMMDTGNVITAGSTTPTLATIEQVNPIYVFFDVDERTLQHIKKYLPDGKVPDDAARRFPLSMGSASQKLDDLLQQDSSTADPSNRLHTGTLQIANNLLDPSTGTLRMWASCDNGNNELKSGMFMRVHMGLGEPRPRLYVSEDALGSDQGRKYLYVVDKDNKIQRRYVEPGQRHDGRIAVNERTGEGTDGLAKDDRVVVKGLQLVRMNMEVNPVPVPMPKVRIPGTGGQGAPPKGSGSQKQEEASKGSGSEKTSGSH
jgi:RND family efflux transporter MFP subunit